ncbi:MAG: RagB/SusD family nutrient uptake outer membrane protein [Prevotella sp.]|nr:RagB/SusD family nutrient uptake outer membrane protein [Prevotella sp.]MBR1506030.1 RagB/SusD family nutrient uptake outer membrane protein [Prevotella sp.]
MNIKNIKIFLAASVMGLGLTSCEEFLNRPTIDNYVADGYYKTDAECIAAVDYLYNSPWYDFQRGFFAFEIMAGNLYMSDGGDYTAFLRFGLTSNNQHIRNMSYSLWAVNAHSNVVRHYIEGGGASEAVKNQTMGECLLWKAMAYFFLVRTFGDVPIVHDNTEMIESGTYNDQMKVYKSDVYEYIVMTLEKAIELLPEQCTEGRLDKYCAKGLLAKVYLTKAGVSGSLNNDDLQKAADLATDVVNNSGRSLEKNYKDCFTLEGNKSPENMIAWRWVVSSQWTSQNSLQSDLGMTGMDEFGDCWGEWSGPSVDLQDAFGFNILDAPETRPDVDTRRRATMMTVGDVVPYLWRDHGGFDYMHFEYDKTYNPGAWGQHRAPTGCNVVKHLYGNNADHVTALGTSASRMASSLCTPLLRLADVYLILAEAKVLMGQTTDATALRAFNAVRQRAIPNAIPETSLTFDKVWKERRLELALEGDRWFDFVRLAYYNPEKAISELKAQRRNSYWNLDPMYKNYYETGQWLLTNNNEDGEEVTAAYDDQTPTPNVTVNSFIVPFPMEDLTFNPHLKEDPVHVDIRATYQY